MSVHQTLAVFALQARRRFSLCNIYDVAVATTTTTHIADV